VLGVVVGGYCGNSFGLVFDLGYRRLFAVFIFVSMVFFVISKLFHFPSIFIDRVDRFQVGEYIECEVVVIGP
jgi:hypothetical protein